MAARIRNELARSSKNPIPGISISQDPCYPEDLFHLLGAIIGPANTPYEDSLFFLSIKLPPNYPWKPPNITFLTPIYHPNISKAGENCLDIFGINWSPALTIPRVLCSLRELMEDPDPDDPFEAADAGLYKRNRADFERVAREKSRFDAW
jgi:ubiquitin-conjugating enzyme E2 D/E